MLSAMLSERHAPDLSIAVVEDDAPLRETLCAAINAQTGMFVAASFDRIAPAMAWLAHHPIDVLLTDLGLPDGSGIDLIRACAASHPRCDIMVITMFGDEKNVLASIEAGAVGYILKDTDQLDVARFIADLRQGGSPMSPLVARKLLLRSQPAQPMQASPAMAAAPIKLTPREQEALDLIARGYTYGEIASLLAVSVNTVQTHIKNTYAKLSVHSRSEAVFEAQKMGLLQGGLLVPDTARQNAA
jgi:DNA-binding NarL/FixJ family response regulator